MTQGPEMHRPSFGSFIKLLLLAVLLWIAACSDQHSSSVPLQAPVQPITDPDHVVARVGDQVVSVSDLNALLNSAALLGLPLAEPGTPEYRQQMRTMLNKAISANLIYLDARRNGIDRMPSYLEDVARFEDALIASLYHSRVMIGNVQASELEILDYYNTQTGRESDLTDELRLNIGSIIRAQKAAAIETTLRERLRQKVEVVIDHKVLSRAYDYRRSDADVVATVDGHRISWSQVKLSMLDTGDDGRSASYLDDDSERLERLEQYLDNAIMTLKGREAGLDSDPVFLRRTAEYRKTRLINEHRNGLIHSWNPSADELQRYFATHRDSIVLPRARRIQMIVVKTREEAESIKDQIDDDELTIYQAALLHSIDPEAKHTLGDIGWVTPGSGYPELEAFAFNLAPGVLAGPVQSPAGWHLVKVIDVRPAQFDDLDEPATRERVFKAYMQDRLEEHIADLRQQGFNVAVYEDKLEEHLKRQTLFISRFNEASD
jgi:parvulin-like peptidyl-prolyl isomerase